MANQYTINPETLEERFLKYVKKTDACWLWTGNKSHNGYGQIEINGKCCRAHRVSYQLYRGETPNNLQVCHSCDIKSCVNPEHLFLGTAKENIKDKVTKNRQAKGNNVAGSKLNSQQVLEIRNKYIPFQYTTSMLAEEYGISRATVHRIAMKKIWRHV